MFPNPVSRTSRKLSIFQLILFLAIFTGLAHSYDDNAVCQIRDQTLSKYNRLIRVDNIAPTCYQHPYCKHFRINSAVISVDKSLPYLGTANCCYFFELLYPVVPFNASLKYKPKLVAHITNLTVLEGSDWITFSTGEPHSLKLLKNLTSRTKNNYDPIYIDGGKVSVEFNKDINFRSIFEIVVNTYYDGDSYLCTDEKRFFRCGNSNTSDCIEKLFLCDHYPQCVYGEDEDIDCEQYEIEKTFQSYDKRSVLIIFLVLVTMISVILLLVSLLCFFRNKERISKTFLSIFGENVKNEKETMYTLLDQDHHIEQ